LRTASIALAESLEGEACQQLHVLRDTTASLGRSCGEYHEAATSMVKVQHAKEEGLDRQGRVSWWWWIWRCCHLLTLLTSSTRNGYKIHLYRQH
jgi:hypothetical protein